MSCRFQNIMSAVLDQAAADENNIAKIAECDFNYVGVSLDGIRETHDKFRRLDGAFEASLKGIRLCRDLGLKIGVRFTMTQDNAHDLPALLKLVEDARSWNRRSHK